MPPATFTGIVTKCGVMNKTVTVTVSRMVAHKKTGKELVRSKKYLTHDEQNALRLDDHVLIRNCRPLSARKRFTLERIIKSPEGEREEAHRRLRVAEQVLPVHEESGSGSGSESRAS